MTEPGVWSLSAVVASRVAALRRRAGISREELAKMCRTLGAPESFSGSVVANIETGRPDVNRRRRRDVSVDELALLAAALDTSPVLLMCPIGESPEVEVLPGHITPMWTAVAWISGEIDPLSDSYTPSLIGDRDAWGRNVLGLQDLRSHADLLDRWRFETSKHKGALRALEEAERSENSDAEAARERVDAEARAVESLEVAIAEARASLRDEGIEPGPLPRGAEHIDQRRRGRR